MIQMEIEIQKPFRLADSWRLKIKGTWRGTFSWCHSCTHAWQPIVLFFHSVMSVHFLYNLEHWDQLNITLNMNLSFFPVHCKMFIYCFFFWQVSLSVCFPCTWERLRQDISEVPLASSTPSWSAWECSQDKWWACLSCWVRSVLLENVDCKKKEAVFVMLPIYLMMIMKFNSGSPVVAVPDISCCRVNFSARLCTEKKNIHRRFMISLQMFWCWNHSAVGCHRLAEINTLLQTESPPETFFNTMRCLVCLLGVVRGATHVILGFLNTFSVCWV